jgi:hypothetical protein
MRNYLLTGAAAVAMAGLLSTGAQAQSPVFPVQSTAGKLDGAAPGSVTVTFGGRIFSALEFQNGTGDTGPNRTSSPNLVDYVRLYPGFDYTNPAGIHFGAAFEIRTNGAQQGVGSGHDSFFAFSGVGYVSSDRFGKVSVGTPNSAIDQLGVGDGDDFGTGGFFGEYGWANAAIWAMADAYDGDVPKQKLAYYSPSFYGLSGAISYQPTSVGLNNSGALVDQLPLDNTQGAIGAQSRNRIEVALQYAHAFGPAAIKADVGYAFANAAVVGDVGGYQNVDMFNAGFQGNLAGFELEGSVNTGKWAYNTNDSGSPFGPSLDHAHNTTAYIVGVGYVAGPYSIGAQYYGVRFDQGDFGAISNATGALNTGAQGKMDGFAVGGSYVVGPGVSVNFDVATNKTTTKGATFTTFGGLARDESTGTLLGIGTYFNW